MDTPGHKETENAIIELLKTIYDPEIPVNIYDLGLIYEIRVDEDRRAHIRMTLTAPNCPMADHILKEVKEKAGKVENVSGVEVKLTFIPPWDPGKLSDEVKLELGLL